MSKHKAVKAGQIWMWTHEDFFGTLVLVVRSVEQTRDVVADYWECIDFGLQGVNQRIVYNFLDYDLFDLVVDVR